MSPAVKGPRRYDSTRRQEQARENRWAVLQAARHRFLERGYAATTMAEIASDVGLSVESVYKMFANKAGLVKAVYDVSVAGDDEPIPIVDREDVQRVIAEPDPARKIDLFAEHISRNMRRAGPVQLMLRDAAASDPAAAAVWEETRAEFLSGMRSFAENLKATGKLRDLSVNHIRDVLWTFNSVEVYAMLVIERGWSARRHAGLVAETLKSALLPG